MSEPVTTEALAPVLSKRVAGLCLAGIVLLGLGLRLYRLEDQSIWIDEFITVCKVTDRNLTTSLRTLPLNSPEQAISHPN